MSRTYLCTKLSFGGFQCGETDPEKFPKGRFSECKECKNRYIREYSNNKRHEGINNVVEKIDPKKELRLVIENTISNEPLFKGFSIVKAIERGEETVSDLSLNISEKIDMLNRNIKLLFHENELLRNELNFLKEKTGITKTSKSQIFKI
jgi:hypothetical protein